MIAQLLACAVLISGFGGCVYQAIGSYRRNDRRAALTWSGNSLVQVGWAGLLAWGGFWS